MVKMDIYYINETERSNPPDIKKMYPDHASLTTYKMLHIFILSYLVINQMSVFSQKKIFNEHDNCMLRVLLLF